MVGVNGGVTRDNIDHVASPGLDLIVAGSAVFADGAVTEYVRLMLAASMTVRKSKSPNTLALVAAK